MPDYLDLEVTLDHVRPRIWRRFLLDERASFLDLHHAIQDACGWEDRHLFAFRGPTGEVVAGLADDFGFGDPDPDAAQVSAGDHLGQHAGVTYEYDFGDGWEHTVTLEGVEALDEMFTRRLVDGARAFPPEDCGGLPGYEDAVAVASGGEARYHDTEVLREWLGGWNPEAFDLEVVRSRFDR